MKKLIFLFSLMLAFKATAETKESPNLKWDAETSLISRKYQLEGYPTKKLDNAFWLARKDSTYHFRYLHAMLVAAFYSERADQLKQARLWLADYQCENIMACSEEQSFLDISMKAYALILKKNELQLLRKIQNKVDARVVQFKLQKPKTSGICAPAADRKKWFELGYEIYCPPFKTLTAQADTEHLTTKSLLKLIEMQSGQMVMSSSRVMDFGHDGDIDCESPWTVQLKCEAGGKDVAYKLNCERTKGSTKVSCSEEKK